MKRMENNRIDGGMRKIVLNVMIQCETFIKGCGDRIIHYNFSQIYSERDSGRVGIGFVLSQEIAWFIKLRKDPFVYLCNG